jgi:hypothetical protein
VISDALPLFCMGVVCLTSLYRGRFVAAMDTFLVECGWTKWTMMTDTLAKKESVWRIFNNVSCGGYIVLADVRVRDDNATRRW